MAKKCINIMQRADDSFLVTVEYSFLSGRIKYEKKFESGIPEIPKMWDWYTFPKRRFITKYSLVQFLDDSVNEFNEARNGS